jgi:hypothetical protein
LVLIVEKLKLFITKLKMFCIRGTQIHKVKTRTAQTAPTKTSFAAIWNRIRSTWNVKGKGQVRPRTGHEGSEGKWMRSSTLSLTSTLEGSAWLTPRPANLPPGKRHRTDCMGGWVRTRAGLDGCEKSRPHRDFFVLSCTLNVLHPFLLLCLDYPASCLLLSLLYDTRYTNIHVTVGIQTRNLRKRSAAGPRFRPLGHWDWRQTLALDRSATGIRTRNPSKRPAADSPLRPLG